MDVTISVTQKRTSLLAIAAAFILGELWGHVGHGIDVQHIIASAVQSAMVFGIIYLLRDGKPEPK